MRICPIQNCAHKYNAINHTKNNTAPNFKSSMREVYKNQDTGDTFAITGPDKIGDAKFLYSNYTYFFRSGVPVKKDGKDWLDFAQLLDEEFKNAHHVNIYDFGCSDGSEACSIAISLIEALGKEKAKKFFPIMASDADYEIIKDAKRGKFDCTMEDIDAIDFHTNLNHKKYFNISNMAHPIYYKLESKDILKNTMNFKHKDFIAGLDEIKGKNNLIICRNFWAYMSPEKRDEAIQKLKEKTDSTSRIMIDTFDKEKGIGAKLEEAGFIEIQPNLYKPKTKIKRAS